MYTMKIIVWIILLIIIAILINKTPDDKLFDEKQEVVRTRQEVS